jgi:hypothetical protein
MFLRTCGSFKSAHHKKDWVRKSQLCKESHLRKVRKSNKLFMSANLRNLFADLPPFRINKLKEGSTMPCLLKSEELETKASVTWTPLIHAQERIFGQLNFTV